MRIKPRHCASSPVRLSTAATARSLCGRKPAHYLPAQEARDRSDFHPALAVEPWRDRSDEQQAREWPLGARLVLEPYGYVVEGYMAALGLKHGCSIFPTRDDIGEFVRARFPYLFCFSGFQAFTPRSARGVLGPVPSPICAAILGFDQSTVIEAWEWVIRNDRPGGRSGQSSAQVLWLRDIRKFLKRYDQIRTGKATGVLADYAARHKLNGEVHDVVAHLMKRLFDFERAAEWLTGYYKLIAGNSNETWRGRALARAEVSPLSLVIALGRPDLIDKNKPAQHAHLNVRLLTGRVATGDPEKPYARIRPRHQFLGGGYHTYDLCLGRDDLGFLVRTIYWMWREHRGNAKLNNVDRSLIYRLALNFIAWINPDRATRHLADRLRGKRYANAATELEESGIMPTLFGRPVRSFKTPACNAIFDDPVCQFGASYVQRIVDEERDRETRGSRNPACNPLMRAGFCPDAWDTPMCEDTLVETWRCGQVALQRLDDGYASPGLPAKQLQAARRYALTLSEMPVAPLTDFLFGCHIAVPYLSFASMCRDGLRQ